MGTAKDLTITSWVPDVNDSALTIAVPGVKLTGWWPKLPPGENAFSELGNVWPEHSVTVKLERDLMEDIDGKKHQFCAYVRIREYPSQWLDVIQQSLRFFINQGALISWAGGWECFLHYTEDESFRGCYAAYTLETGLIGAGGLEDPVTYVDTITGATKRLHAAVRRGRELIDKVNRPSSGARGW